MSSAIGPALQKGLTMRQLVTRLGTVQDAGRTLGVSAEERCTPYLDSTVVSWVDGPPTSAVAYVLCGADAHGHGWRRWTLAKVGPWRYELGVFPTPFKNDRDPLSPGVPPSSSRPR